MVFPLEWLPLNIKLIIQYCVDAKTNKKRVKSVFRKVDKLCCLKKSSVNRLVQCSEWGQPLDLYDLRVIVKNYLDKVGRRVDRFQNNMPGMEFAMGFIKRHKERLSMRFC